MSIETLKQRLNSLGYHTTVSAYLSVARKVSDKDPRIIELDDSFCAVTFIDGKWLLSRMRSQVPDWVAFGSEDEVVAHIKKHFPL